ncbi:MAG: cytochrome P450 [Ilumatobacter sp.]
MTEKSTPPMGCPITTIDPYADDFLADRYSGYQQLRDLGSVVWLERYGIAALTRHDSVRAALNDHERFSSSSGQSVCEEFNERMPENILNTDPPLHEQYRRPLLVQLTPSALAPDLEKFDAIASEMTDRLVAATTFDAVRDLTSPYSVRIVADLIGLPEEGRDLLGPLGELAFNLMGPANDRHRAGDEALNQLMGYTLETAMSGQLCPGTRGADLVEAGLALALGAYTWPGIDTTVHALSSAILLFAQHPDQWELLRSDPSMANAAFNEVLRMHSPVQAFTRVTTTSVDIDGVVLPEGVRVAVMYGAANRDERRYDDPDRFDITRNARDQLAFGRGIHLCVGSHLARAEAASLFNALIERVERFELTAEPQWSLNNVLHGLASLPVRIRPAA